MALFRHLTIAVIVAGAFASPASQAPTTADQDLIGLWEARRSFTAPAGGEYLWWPREYTHQGRLIRTYRADGNGGQYVVVVPELELVVASFAGNYSEAAAAHLLRTIVPRYILPAAR